VEGQIDALTALAEEKPSYTVRCNVFQMTAR
jgi:hypothetical protein